MNHDDLRSAIETLWPGHGGQAEAARQFGISDRTMRRYLAPADTTNHRAVPEWLDRDIRDLLAQFPGGMRQVDPRQTLAVLHEQMQRAGWRPEESAAGILGAALALARETMGGDSLKSLWESG